MELNWVEWLRQSLLHSLIDEDIFRSQISHRPRAQPLDTRVHCGWPCVSTPMELSTQFAPQQQQQMVACPQLITVQTLAAVQMNLIEISNLSRVAAVPSAAKWDKTKTHGSSAGWRVAGGGCRVPGPKTWLSRTSQVLCGNVENRLNKFLSGIALLTLQHLEKHRAASSPSCQGRKTEVSSNRT